MSDQTVQNRIASLKLKREILKKIDEVLQGDPDLREKMLHSGQGRGAIYREELSRLRSKQLMLIRLTREIDISHKYSHKNFQDVLQKRLIDLSSQTTNAMGNARIWIPKKATKTQRGELQKSFSDISNITSKIAETPLDQISLLNSLFDQLEQKHKQAEALFLKNRIKNLDQKYTQIRLIDLNAMQFSIKENRSLLNHLANKDYKKFIIQIQKELNNETKGIVLGLSSSLSGLVGVSEKIDGMIKEINEIMEKNLLTSQSKIINHKKLGWNKHTLSHQKEAAYLIKKGVTLLDEVIEEFVLAKNEIDRSRGQQTDNTEELQLAKDPTQAQIAKGLRKALAALETEVRGSTIIKLGIGTTSNLNIIDDWDKEQNQSEKQKEEDKIKDEKSDQGSDQGSGQTEGGGGDSNFNKQALTEQQRRQNFEATKRELEQMKKAQSAAAEVYKLAAKQSKGIAGKLNNKVAIPWSKRQFRLDDNESWNKLVSKLDQNVKQDANTNIPEKYRKAIQQYFREIAEVDKK